jgi:hypothetical protein
MHVAIDAADCNGHPATPFKLTIVALLGPIGAPAPGGEWGMGEDPQNADALPLAIGGSAASQQAAAAAGNPGSGYRSISTLTSVNEYSVKVRTTRTVPTSWVIGQVVDVPKMHLTVGTGVDGGSIISGMKTDARLEARTTLIMLPALPAGQTAAAAATAPGGVPVTPTAADAALAAVAATVPTPDAADEAEICSGNCNHLGTGDTTNVNGGTRAGFVSISQLGFAPHDKEKATTFNHETDLTYLDEHHLLCTFDPHKLRIRANDDADAVRTIRALMIEPSTHQITNVMEWKVRGSDAYLWRAGEGRVLVHVGHALRLYDAQLQVIKEIPVSGPVAWVVSSPSSDHLAIAVKKERYSEEMEQEIRGLNAKPDEDLEVTVYDRELNPLSASIRSSQAPVPVLSDGGELRLAHVSRGHWKIVEFGWDQHEHDLATVRTSCRPLLSTPEHGLVFVVGCMGTTNGTWYRMLRQDGHPLLKAESTTDEIAQTAEAAIGGSFAVRVMKTATPVDVSQPFNRLDLTQEEIAIYRSSDGAKLSSVVTDDFILAQNSYALSPGGDQMAVVGRDSIQFYDVKLR